MPRHRKSGIFDFSPQAPIPVVPIPIHIPIPGPTSPSLPGDPVPADECAFNPPLCEAAVAALDDFGPERAQTPIPVDAAPMHPGNELHLSDGDVTLRSRDGKLFTVHAHMLKMAFAHFNGNFAWHRVRDAPIVMDQDGATLEVLIRLLYPFNTKPSIRSSELLISVLRATNDLGMTSVLVRDELAAGIEGDPNPLRAWALASAFGFPEARRNAAARYIEADSYLPNDAPSELHFADGRKVFELVSARERALRLARAAMSQTSWHCGHCDTNGMIAPPQISAFSNAFVPTRSLPPTENPYLSLYLNAKPDPDVHPEWRREFLSRTVTMNPFASDATSEMCFELCAEKSSCRGCKNSFAVAAAREARKRLRESLKNIFSTILEEIAPL